MKKENDYILTFKKLMELKDKKENKTINKNSLEKQKRLKNFLIKLL